MYYIVINFTNDTMADEKFDCIIVGAGPAGLSAGYTLAKAGLSAIIIERGDYPGAKTVMGGILYSHAIGELIPDFCKEAPLERPITEQRVLLLTEDASIQAGYKTKKFAQEPYNSFSVLRAQFDGWLAQKVDQAGVMVIPKTLVDTVLKENNQVIGIKTDQGEILYADCVLACDGINSLLAQKAGLHQEWQPQDVALAVKEVLTLPKEKIQDRFNLEDNEGCAIEFMGTISHGMTGIGFLYTNKESISLGMGCLLSNYQKSLIKPYDLIEEVKSHPAIKRFIDGAQTEEYLAHLIPEGGYNRVPPLYTDGMLVCGDAALLVNSIHREGSNLAIKSGILAAQTVIEAKNKKDFSKKTLSLYKKKIEESFIIQDLKKYRRLPHLLHTRNELFSRYPQLASEIAAELLTVDGRSKAEKEKKIIAKILGTHSLCGWGKMAFDFWRATR